MLPAEDYYPPEDDDGIADGASHEDGPRNHKGLAAWDCKGPSENMVQGAPDSLPPIVSQEHGANTLSSDLDGTLPGSPPDSAARAGFLTTVFATAPDDMYIHVWVKGPFGNRTYWGQNTPEGLVNLHQHAMDASQSGADVYFGTAYTKQPYGPKKRSDYETVAGIVTLQADFDIETSGDIRSVDNITAFLNRLPLRPSIIVSSGGGIHAYWRLTNAWGFADGDEKRQAAALLKGWIRFLNAQSRLQGLRGSDAVGDLPRLLRYPGTLNYKPENRMSDGHAPEVTILYMGAERYDVDELRQYAIINETHDTTTALSGKLSPGGWLQNQPHLCSDDVESVINRVKAEYGDDIMIDGHLSVYDNDRNRRDMGFCSKVGWCCDFDPHTIDAVYRRTDFARLKWDDRHTADGLTYGELTMSKICVGDHAMPKQGEATKTEGTDKPIIIENGPDTNAVLHAYKAALATATIGKVTPRIYTGKDNLFRYIEDLDGMGRLDPLTKDNLCHEILQVAQPAKQRAKGLNYGPPDPKLLGAVLADDQSPFPSVLGITDCPVVRKDKSIVLEPGYDPISRWIYHPASGLILPRISECPTRHDVVAAARYLLENPLHGFAYATQADRANALAALIAPLLRPVVGRIPFFLETATKHRTGKGLEVIIKSLRNYLKTISPSSRRIQSRMLATWMNASANRQNVVPLFWNDIAPITCKR